MAAFDADERGDLSGLHDPLDVGGGAGRLEYIGIASDHRFDELDLLQRVLEGRPLLHGFGRDIHAPKLSADAAFAEARNVGVHFRLRLADVAFVEGAIGLGSHLPGQIVVAVEDEAFEVDLAGFVGKDDGSAALSESRRGEKQEGSGENRAVFHGWAVVDGVVNMKV